MSDRNAVFPIDGFNQIFQQLFVLILCIFIQFCIGTDIFMNKIELVVLFPCCRWTKSEQEFFNIPAIVFHFAQQINNFRNQIGIDNFVLGKFKTNTTQLERQ